MACHSKRWLALSILGIFIVITCALVWNYSAVSTTARWLLWSRRYKSEVLSQPTSRGELKHIEWDGWGLGGQETVVYLVFDPTDTLSSAASTHQSGKFADIPCEVPEVTRFESQWCDSGPQKPSPRRDCTRQHRTQPRNTRKPSKSAFRRPAGKATKLI